VNDSGGQPLANTPPASFLRLLAEMVAEDFAPVPLLACLKHPLAAAGAPQAAFRADIRLLEKLLLRGPRPAPGIAGLRAALAAEAPPEEPDGRRPTIGRVVDRIEKALAPFVEAMTERRPAAELVAAHAEAAERLAATQDEEGAARLWQGEAGEATADFIRELIDAAPAFG